MTYCLGRQSWSMKRSFFDPSTCDEITRSQTKSLRPRPQVPDCFTSRPVRWEENKKKRRIKSPSTNILSRSSKSPIDKVMGGEEGVCLSLHVPSAVVIPAALPHSTCTIQTEEEDHVQYALCVCVYVCSTLPTSTCTHTAKTKSPHLFRV